MVTACARLPSWCTHDTKGNLGKFMDIYSWRPCWCTPLSEGIYTSLALYTKACEVALYQIQKKPVGIVEGSSNCSILQCLHWLPVHRSWYAAGYTADFPVTAEVDFTATDTLHDECEIWLGKKKSQWVFLRCSQHSELPAGWLLWINPKSL